MGGVAPNHPKVFKDEVMVFGDSHGQNTSERSCRGGRIESRCPPLGWIHVRPQKQQTLSLGLDIYIITHVLGVGDA